MEVIERQTVSNTCPEGVPEFNIKYWRLDVILINHIFLAGYDRR